MSERKEREFDVIVWGATGFTGRLVAEYLHEKYQDDPDFTWAIAGRNPEKIGEVAKEIGIIEKPFVVANSDDRHSLDVMCSRTKVVCSTVGPYSRYGGQLVAACVAAGTHYCDLSGETPWIRKMIDLHHKRAVEARVRIVNCCGFDSLPSDLGTQFIQDNIHAKTGEYARHVKLRLKAMSGSWSGGTVESMREVMAAAEADEEVRKMIISPYSLNPDPFHAGADKKDLRAVVKDEDIDRWIAPFMMEGINSRVVRRSHALNGFPYGDDFRYDEAVIAGKGLLGRLKGISMALMMATLVIGKPGSWLRDFLDSRLPEPGEGPDKKARENGFFNFTIIGKMSDGSLHKATFAGDKDPGYGSTAGMLGESAVCLACDDLPDQFGFVTPSVAMGAILRERLVKNAGITVEMQS